jgi:hypothetical protein
MDWRYVRAGTKDELKDRPFGVQRLQDQGTRHGSAHHIARDSLGDPNTKLSNIQELQLGDTGKITVRITGANAGTGSDCTEGTGGALFDLVQHKVDGGFKESKE